MEKTKLNNGVEMPMLGIGTFMLTPDQAENAVYNALKDGYRLIDTANAYMNEKGVGRGIKKSGIPREEIFLETKSEPNFNPKIPSRKKIMTPQIDFSCFDSTSFIISSSICLFFNFFSS